jgi:hypothetical protein
MLSRQNNYQHGFTKGKSTDMALFDHIHQITESVESNRATLAIYLDLAKAFDTVNHRILALKLYAAGIRDSLLQWFVSYLNDRKHTVKIGEAQSKECTQKVGVPQGSVLGPTLFNVYINDLFQMPLQGSILGYADDTSLLYSAGTVSELENQVEQDCGLLLPWFRRNFLHLNISKCKSVVFGYKTPEWANTIKLSTNIGIIERVSAIKYLGLTIDEKLTWKSHSINLQAKLRKICYLFYHLRGYFSKLHLKKLYNPLFESVMSYGIIHWGTCKHVKPIKVLQNRLCRTILGHIRGTSETIIYSKTINIAKRVTFSVKIICLWIFRTLELISGVGFSFYSASKLRTDLRSLKFDDLLKNHKYCKESYIFYQNYLLAGISISRA